MSSPRASLIIEDTPHSHEWHHSRRYSYPTKLKSTGKDTLEDEAIPPPQYSEGNQPKGSVPMIGSIVYFQPKTQCPDEKLRRFRRYSSMTLPNSYKEGHHQVQLTPLEDRELTHRLQNFDMAEASKPPPLDSQSISSSAASSDNEPGQSDVFVGSIYTPENTNYSNVFDFVDSKVKRDQQSRSPERETEVDTRLLGTPSNKHRRRLTCAMVFNKPKIVET